MGPANLEDLAVQSLKMLIRVGLPDESLNGATGAANSMTEAAMGATNLEYLPVQSSLIGVGLPDESLNGATGADNFTTRATMGPPIILSICQSSL
jgi:hypothetical protein